MSSVAIVARVTIKEGRADEYVAAFAPLLEQAQKEPGTVIYAVNRSKDDPHVFWTTEVYADEAAFAAHRSTEVHATAAPVFTDLIVAADVTIGETLMAKGLGEPPHVGNQRSRSHRYRVSVAWTGNHGSGTSGYQAYSRDHEVSADGRPGIAASSDPLFRGDPARWNPELELVAALSQCHMLWYLHLCAVAGVVVVSYTDDADGTMTETTDGGGYFTEVVLRPRVEVALAEMTETATSLHKQAHTKCFIANSVNFPVRHEPVITTAQ